MSEETLAFVLQSDLLQVRLPPLMLQYVTRVQLDEPEILAAVKQWGEVNSVGCLGVRGVV
jgi:hypothetical protein